MKKFAVCMLALCLVLSFGLLNAFAADNCEIAFSLKTVTNDDFQKAIADSVQKEVEAKGCKFTLITAGTETAVSTQVNQVEDLITKGVTGIVLNPMDANAVIPALEKAKAANIPVVLVDSTIASGHEDLYVTYIGTDNFAAAKLGGQTLAKALNGEGKVLIVRGANGNSVGNARVDGFKEGIKDSKLEIVGEQPGDWSNDTAMQVTENMLQANPKVDAIFTASDVMLNGILTALDDAGLKDVKILSFDGSKAGVDLIESGKVFGDMAQFPQVMGQKAVDTLLGVKDGSVDAAKIDKFIDSGTECYSKDNLDEAKKSAF